MKDIKLDGLTIFMVPFFLVCGGTYQVCYWSCFDFDAMPYLSITSVVKSSSYVIWWPFLLSLLPVFFEKKADPNLPFNKKELIITVASVLIFLCIITLVLFKEYFKFVFIFYCLFSLVLLVLQYHPDYTKLPNHKILVFCFALLFNCVFWGVIAGKVVADNKSFDFVSIKRNGIRIYKSGSDTLKVLGKGEDYYMLSSLQNSNVILVDCKQYSTLIINKVNSKYDKFPYKFSFK